MLKYNDKIIKDDDIFGVRIYWNHKDFGGFYNEIYGSLGSAKTAMHSKRTFNIEGCKDLYYCIYTYNREVYYYSVVYGALDYVRKTKGINEYTKICNRIEIDNIPEFIEVNI